MNDEVWKPVMGSPIYEVSDQGRVRSVGRMSYGRGSRWLPGKMMKLVLQGNGYMTVDLYGENRRGIVGVHRLVLESFIGPCPEGMEGCHNDGNRSNNHLKNLRWDTHRNNKADQIKHGTHTRGERNHWKKLTWEKVADIRRLFKQGFVAKRLSEKYGVTPTMIRSVVKNKCWVVYGPTGRPDKIVEETTEE